MIRSVAHTVIPCRSSTMDDVYAEWMEHALPGSGWLVEFKNDGLSDTAWSALTRDKMATLVKLLERCSYAEHRPEDRVIWLPNASTGGTLCKYVFGELVSPDDSSPFGTITCRPVGDYPVIRLRHSACAPRPVQVTIRDAADPAYVTVVVANPLNGLELFVDDFPADQPIRCLEFREEVRIHLVGAGQISKHQVLQLVQGDRVLRGNAVIYHGNVRRRRGVRARIV